MFVEFDLVCCFLQLRLFMFGHLTDDNGPELDYCIFTNELLRRHRSRP